MASLIRSGWTGKNRATRTSSTHISSAKPRWWHPHHIVPKIYLTWRINLVACVPSMWTQETVPLDVLKVFNHLIFLKTNTSPEETLEVRPEEITRMISEKIFLIPPLHLVFLFFWIFPTIQRSGLLVYCLQETWSPPSSSLCPFSSIIFLIPSLYFLCFPGSFSLFRGQAFLCVVSV